jgi:hypothetical protein
MVELCKPATTILFVSVAGIIYHLFMGDMSTTSLWLLVGIVGTGLFQLLCSGGFEPIAWIVFMIPILVVCFFLAVALFASKMRIENAGPCRKPSHHCSPRKHPHCSHSHCSPQPHPHPCPPHPQPHPHPCPPQPQPHPCPAHHNLIDDDYPHTPSLTNQSELGKEHSSGCIPLTE